MHARALRFGELTPFPHRRWFLPPAAWTGIGALAIPLWATWPALATWASAMPPFQILTITSTVGWLVLRLLEPAPSPGADRRRPALLPVLACALGLSGSAALFILATGFIPPAQANLISYLWPVMVVGLGGALGLFRLRGRHFLGLGLGFAGAAIVMGGSGVAASWPGIGLALLSGAAWAAYCLSRLRQGSTAPDVLAAGCAASVPLCAGLHLALEQTVVPGVGAFLAAVGSGVAPLALANLAWDHGLRRGDGRLLAVMAYATPLVAALILITLGLAAATPNLVVGAAMIVGAGALAASGRR